MANQHDTDINILVRKYLKGDCTDEEKALVENWYLRLGHTADNLLEKHVKDDLIELERRLSRIPQRRSPMRLYIQAVAALLCISFTFGAVILLRRMNPENNSMPLTQAMSGDVLPGSNRAILSFDDEQPIELSTHQSGLVNSNGIITYPDGTSIKNMERVQMATLRTPIAGQYQVSLPDGTKVWLNALSSIRYPTAFVDEIREVEITGEVYFEVFPDVKKPFVVKSNQQYVEVLGTSFNINAYGDNGQILTTLTEGSVLLRHDRSAVDVELKPGEQAVVNREKVLEIKAVDTDEIASWKDGLYIVNNEPLKHYARKIERWYDVEVDIANYGDKRFSAIIPRDAKLSEVLQAIELKTDVKFIIKERRVLAEK